VAPAESFSCTSHCVRLLAVELTETPMVSMKSARVFKAPFRGHEMIELE
jgi:hypothetical protein